MKLNTLLFFILAVSLNSNAQSLVEFAFPTESNKIIYQDVVKVDSSLKANDLYLDAKKWIAEKFKSANDVIQMDDTEAIVVKAFISKGHNAVVTNAKKWFTLTLEFKDGRYRYTLTDIVYEFDVDFMGNYQHYEEIYDSWLKYSSHPNKRKREKINLELEKYALSVNSEFELIIESLKSSIGNTAKEEEDDW